MKKILALVGFFLILIVVLVWNFLFSVPVEKGSPILSTGDRGLETTEFSAQEREHPKQARNPSAEFLDFLKERGFFPKILKRDTKVDLTNWPKDSAKGARVTRLYGQKAGLPPSKLPGVQFVSLEEVQQIDMTEKKTGLFLVDIEFVPRELPGALKFYKYTLQKDGTLLDANSEPILALVTSEVYLIEKEEAQELVVDSLFNKLLGLIVPKAYAANPFPWRCYSFTPWAVYHSGFHRWYDARTWAGTYGSDSGGGCSSGSPHTRVDYIATWAAVGGGGDSDHCYNCDTEYSRDTWDVGYFWPAHGIPVTSHSAIYADGTFSFSRTAHLTW